MHFYYMLSKLENQLYLRILKKNSNLLFKKPYYTILTLDFVQVLYIWKSQGSFPRIAMICS